MIREELYQYISQLEIIDCHEHLQEEWALLEEKADFTTMVYQYCRGDFAAAGMSPEEEAQLYGDATPPERKWEIYAKYYPYVADTSYMKASRLALRHHYGIEELTAENYSYVSKKIQEQRKPGIYKRMLADSKIKCVMNNGGDDRIPCGVYVGKNTDELKSVPRVPYHPESADFKKEGTFYSGVTSLEGLDARAQQFVQRVKEAGGHGLKVMNGYPYEEVDEIKAQSELVRLLDEGGSSVSLYWYVLDRILEEAARLDLPIAVHTGYWGDFRAHSPEKYLPLIDRHPENRFDVFHLGYPYVKQSLMLAKTRANVVLDLCWTYIISQQFAYDSLCQIIDLLPMNKVLGFGGDLRAPERIWGHREMMNQTMSRVLAAKVEDGTLTLERAKRWAYAMLVENPIRFYGLE